jgi:hypothetical protein
MSEYPDVKSPHVDPEPRPVGKGSRVVPQVCLDLMAREAMGEKKYGEKLRCFNGRRALVDAYQEALDLCVYLKQCLLEEEACEDDGK